MKTEDQMVECFRKCGAFVPIEGPAVCASCLVGPAPADSRLRFTERYRGPIHVQTIGYAIHIHVADPTHRMLAREARIVAQALNDAADFVEKLESPYTNKDAPR